MSVTFLKDGKQQFVGQVFGRSDSGDQRLLDMKGNVLGRYDASVNKTYDTNGLPAGEGNMLTMLLNR
jgi:hypothetical protein